MSPRVAFIMKRSAWSTMVQPSGGTRLRRLIAEGDPTVSRLRSTHDAHTRTVDELHAAFDRLGVEAVPIDDSTRNITARKFALVVTVGGDGTLLRASHSVRDAPVLGINSAPSSSVGFFCGIRGGDGVSVMRAIEQALDGRLSERLLTRMCVTVGKRTISERVLNDALFCHRSPAATSRYLIEHNGQVEEHKSSGFWVGPAAGSTAAQRSAGGRVLSLKSRLLQLVVREPYTPSGERYRLLKVLVEPTEKIVVRSKMREAVLFLDGPDIGVTPQYGDVITFQESSQPLRLLAIGGRRATAAG